jgi:checkpoint serine/threonine-protein kinase
VILFHCPANGIGSRDLARFINNGAPTFRPSFELYGDNSASDNSTSDNMSTTEDLINFDIIESQKENIQSLPGGRSARKLVDLFSPSPLHKLLTPTPSDTKNLNDAIRGEYEAELVNISESDDPLDIYDRYVRWTLDAYPTAQATPQSQLLPLLERATKAFLKFPQYKNDPRYLKLWLSYIRFFSDSPRETFAFLARHNIGDGLALFYEEFASWLEGAGRWNQADEVYKMGIEREARPTPRLLRKYNEFQARHAQQPQDANEPSSPALPTMRPALAAKIDPFAPSTSSPDPQAPRPNSGIGGSATAKPGRQKLAVFSDDGNAATAPESGVDAIKGWESIGSLAERKKENTIEPKPWVGETLKVGGKKGSAPKMAIFKDQVSLFSFNPTCQMLMIIGLIGGFGVLYSVSTSIHKSSNNLTIARTGYGESAKW